MAKNIVLVGHDAAPSRAFLKLAPVFLGRGHSVTVFAADGKPRTTPLAEIQTAAASADAVVLGMSSSKELAEEEIAAGVVAEEKGILYGFYGDVRNCWGRARGGSCFAPLAENAGFYLGVNEADAGNARAVFPSARLIGTGNPLREEMFFPKVTREEVRTKLGIGDNVYLILTPGGGKCAAVNIGIWSALADAVAELDFPLQVVIACHPGDRTPFAVDPPILEGEICTKNVKGEPGIVTRIVDAISAMEKLMFSRTDVLAFLEEVRKEIKALLDSGRGNLHTYDEVVKYGGGKFRIVPKAEMETASLVVGSDVVVEFGSSEGMRAACLRIPVITYVTALALARLESVQGSRELELVDDGGSKVVWGNALGLRTLIDNFTVTKGKEAADLRASQEAGYPKPERPGAILEAMAEAVESFCFTG